MSTVDHFEQRRQQARRAALVYQIALWSAFLGSSGMIASIVLRG